MNQNWVVVQGQKAINQEHNGGLEGAVGVAFSGAGGRTTARARTGRYSAALSNETLTLTGAALPNAAHLVSAWAYGDPLTALGVGSTLKAPTVLDEQGGWRRYGALFTAGECNGQTTRQTVTAGATWVDDVCTQAAASWDDASEAFDGDTPGCRWLGPAHRAPSLRPAEVLDNGQILAVDDNETVWCKLAVPPSLAPLDVLKQEATGSATQIYQDTRLKERAIRLELHVKVGGFRSATDAREGWHKRIARLQRLFPPRRPFAVRYVGGARPQEYRVALVGFEVVKVEWTAGHAVGDVVVLLTALDPRPRELGETRAPLALNRSLALSYFTTRDGAADGLWTGRGSGPGGPLRRVYVAPDHTEYVCTANLGGTAYVKRRNADNTWTVIASVTGSLVGGPVVYDCVQTPDGAALYVAGDFIAVNGVTGCNGVAVVNLGSLDASALDSGCATGVATRLLLTPAADYLVVAGSFTSISGLSANRIARRSLSTGAWSTLGAGLAGAVYALRGNAAGDLYAGGDFGASSGLSALGAPTPTSTYVGGGLLQPGGIYQFRVTAVTAQGETDASPSTSVTVVFGRLAIPYADDAVTVSWSAAAGATGYRVWATEERGTTFWLLATVGAGVTSYLWDGTQALDRTQTPPTVNTSGHRTVNLARWDAADGTWNNVGVTGVNGIVHALDVAPNGVDLCIVGDFTLADGAAAGGVAWWQGGALIPCGSGVAGGSALSVKMLHDGRVVVVGTFTSAGGMTAGANMAYWTGGPRGAWLPADIVWPSNAVLYSVTEHYNDLLVGHDSAGTATAAALTTVTVEGTAGSQPVWEVTGPCTLRALINQRTGEGLYFSEAAALAASETWRFDSADLAKTLTSSGRAGSLVSRILVGSQRGRWRLEPDDNPVLLLATGTTADSASVLRDRVTNLSADGSLTDE